MNHIERAIKAIGSPVKLAAACDQHRQAVTRWRKTGKPPANHALTIEIATGGKVTRYQLRPDVFGKDPRGKK